MSTQFDDRKNAFETKYANDQQMLFRVEAKACKAFGLWVAEQMGLSGDTANNYANDMVVANLDQPGLDDAIDKAVADLTIKGVNIPRVDLAQKLGDCLSTAKDAVMRDVK
jgi:hypothetical protein